MVSFVGRGSGDSGDSATPASARWTMEQKLFLLIIRAAIRGLSDTGSVSKGLSHAISSVYIVCRDSFFRLLCAGHENTAGASAFCGGRAGEFRL